MPAVSVSQLEARPHERPDELRTPPKTRVEIVRLHGVTLARFTMQPGWKWSECVKPVAGTDSCRVPHAGYTVSGTLNVQLSSGASQIIRAGDSYTIPPGHDAWVVGDAPYVAVEVLSASAEEYGKRPAQLLNPVTERRRRITLAFADPDVEAAFAKESAPGRWRHLRSGALLSALLWAAIGGVALVSGLPHATAAAGVAWGGMLPVALLTVLLNARGPDMARQQLTGAFSNVAAGVAGLAMNVLLESFDRYALPTLLIIALAAFSFLGLRFIYALSSSLVSTLAYAVIVVMRGGPPFAVSAALVLALAALIAGATGAYYLEAANREAFLERRKSDRLLLNILPESIAERLKEDPSVVADAFDSATVLFADIVGFTTLSTRMPPQQLVRILDELFSAFDGMAARHYLEKIKTIGDAYMVAGGVPKPRRDHTHAVCEMALEMLAFVERYSRENALALNVRIGVHTGAVVAGVIGKQKFIYDLWGDTVNTASRMESHSLPGRAQLSAAAWDVVRDDYEADERGEIDVKGKGPMRTYLLRGRRAG